MESKDSLANTQTPKPQIIDTKCIKVAIIIRVLQNFHATRNIEPLLPWVWCSYLYIPESLIKMAYKDG